MKIKIRIKIILPLILISTTIFILAARFVVTIFISVASF